MELVWDLGTINVLTRLENNARKFSGHECINGVCPAASPSPIGIQGKNMYLLAIIISTFGETFLSIHYNVSKYVKFWQSFPHNVWIWYYFIVCDKPQKLRKNNQNLLTLYYCKMHFICCLFILTMLGTMLLNGYKTMTVSLAGILMKLVMVGQTCLTGFD